MGFLDSIFGSGGGEVVNPASFETLPTLSPEQKKLLNEELIPFLSGIDRFQPTSFGQFSDRGTAENLSLQALEGFSESLVSGQAGQTAAAGTEALGDIFSAGPRDIDEFFRQTVQDPLLEQFQEDILPGISRRFSGNSFFDTERASADQRASEELIDSLTRARTETAFNERARDIQSQIAGFGQLPNVLGAVPGATGQAGAASQVLRTPSGELQFEQQDFQNQQDQIAQRINQILGALGVNTIENIAFAPTVSGGQDSSFGDILSGVGSIAAIPGLFSDRRLKENIEQIGILPKTQLPVYHYNYISTTQVRTGVMADEVATVMPAAVGIREGWYTVDYGMLLTHEERA